MILSLGTTPALQRTMIFPRLRLDAVNRAVLVHQFASGKPINVVRVLHALGREAMVSGFLGGESGKSVRADLDRTGIAHDFIEVIPPTRMCVTVVDQGAGQATELIEESGAVDGADWDALLEKLSTLIERAKALVLSGSLAPGGPADFYDQCVRLASAAGTPVVLDAKGEALRLALPHRSFLVKPNRIELGETLGLSTDSTPLLCDALAQLVQEGPQWALVTLGPEGALLANGRQMWRITVPAIKAISPIGSGDATAAGVAAGIVQGLAMPQAAGLGAACGVANALTPHAGHVNPEDVERLQREVRVESMSS